MIIDGQDYIENTGTIELISNFSVHKIFKSFTWIRGTFKEQQNDFIHADYIELKK